MWKDIDGYDNYEVSEDGQVRNKKTQKILSQYNNGPSIVVSLHNNYERKHHKVSDLVSNAFYKKVPTNDYNFELNDFISFITYWDMIDKIIDDPNDKDHFINKLQVEYKNYVERDDE